MSIAPYPAAKYRLARRVLAALCLSCGVAAVSSAESSADAGPIIELPKFVVTDSRELPEPESWRYATLPGFEILSSASDRATLRLVKDFQMFREALDLVWPMPNRLNTPVFLVLCGKGRQFEAFEPPNADGRGLAAHASLYLKGRTQSAIVIDLASSVVNVAAFDMTIDTSVEDSTRISVDHNKQLYREYVHYLLSRSEPRLPAWFEEGMAQIIMAMDFTPKWIEFGRIEEGGTVSAAAAANAALREANASMGVEADPMDLVGTAPAEDRDFNVALGRRALLPLQKLFDVTHESPEVRNPLGNNTWAKQAYAFVHMGLYGDRGKWQKQFSTFLLRSTREPVTEEMFKQCFNMSYKDMGIQLRGYVTAPMYQAFIIRPKGGGVFLTESKVELRDATPAEIGRIKGRSMLIAGNVAGARTELIAPYVRGERDPQLLAALGTIENAAGKADRARRFLAAAVDAKTTDPEAYLQLSRFRFADASEAPAGPNKQFSEAQVAGITSLLRSARKLPPPNSATYELMADTLARSPQRPTREEATLLIEGAQLFPARLKLVYQVAGLCADAGMADAAHSLVDHGLKHAADPVAKARFVQLKAVLPPMPAPAAIPAGAGAAAEAPAASKTGAK